MLKIVEECVENDGDTHTQRDRKMWRGRHTRRKAQTETENKMWTTLPKAVHFISVLCPWERKRCS